MKQLIEYFINTPEDSSEQSYDCNYQDNYYGDQICQPKNTD